LISIDCFTSAHLAVTPREQTGVEEDLSSLAELEAYPKAAGGTAWGDVRRQVSLLSFG